MSASSRKVIFAALTGNLLIACTKFVAAALSGSSAMFSEGIHSVVDTGNQVLLLYGMRRARQPADERFPFGHGKEVYFWSFVVAILIFAVGAGVSIYEGIRHIVHPTPLEDATINYVVLAVSMAFEGAAWFFALTEFTKAKGKWGYVEAVQRGKDPTVFMVLFEDSAAMLGLLVAAAGIFFAERTGLLWLDGAASVIIGCILGATAIWLAVETKGLLIGESANRHVVADIKAIAARIPAIERVHEVLTMHMGPDYILVNISVRFARGTTAAEIEDAIAALESKVKAAHPAAKRIFVEAEARAGG